MEKKQTSIACNNIRKDYERLSQFILCSTLIILVFRILAFSSLTLTTNKHHIIIHQFFVIGFL